MTTFDATSRLTTPPTWVRILLGVVLILAGLFVLGDVTLATLVSTLFIAAMAIVAGAFEIIHAFWTKGWGGFLWQIVLGAIYIAFGVVLWSQPAAGAMVLTLALGLMLMISGVVRALVSVAHWQEAGWLMLLSGVFGILAGVVVITGFPMSGLWVLGLLLGIDLLSHGIAWLVYAWMPAATTA
jgi:uncharacterized membrane protein HdeD (DUF308 family)